MIIRRHPNLEVMRHHPGGGLYDVLGIIEGAEQVIALNRSGGIHVATRPDAIGRSFTWADYICAADRGEFIADLEQVAGLPAPTRQPLSPSALVFATIAALASLGAQTEPFTIGTGYVDGPAGTQATWWSEMQRRAPDLTQTRPNDHFERAGYRFWRVERSDFVATFETTSATVDVLVNASAS